ncbi:MAG: FemAB family PEP-CTERM system-associated protein [Burkholderiaceae bacterium]|nr:FemAB family PEP-CTERM system-associated protein [Burkholderiaceae bacterium]
MAATPVVREAGDTDAAPWAQYVDAHSGASIFHDWKWRAILREVFGHRPRYLIAEREGRIVGVLPLAEVRTALFGHALVSLPFCSWAGPLQDDRQAESALEHHAIALAESLGVDQLELRQLGPSHRDWPTQDLYVAFMREISGDHDENLNAIPRKQRAMVRKGIKAGLTGTIEDVDAFFPLYADNVHRHGTPPCSRRFFDAMQSAFGPQCEILIVRDPQGTPLSGVLSLIHRNEVFPFYAGDTAAARHCAANDFKYWEVMRRAADQGLRQFNYGRSKRGTGSFSFKKNWGFEPTALSYDFHLVRADSIPQNNPNNPKYRLMIEAWRRMPRWAVNRLGPLIVRGLG